MHIIFSIFLLEYSSINIAYSTITALYASENCSLWIYVRTEDINWFTPHPGSNLEVMLIRFQMHYSFQMSLVVRKSSCVKNAHRKLHMKHEAIIICAAFCSKLLSIHTAHIALIVSNYSCDFLTTCTQVWDQPWCR